MATTWGREQVGRLELCTVVGIHGNGWAEKKVRQLVRNAVLENRAQLVDMRVEPDGDCSYALLEWQVSILARFQKDVLSLAIDLDVQVITLLSAGDPEEQCSQFGSVGPVSEDADVPAIDMPPASFYADMSKLVESLVKTSTISAHQGYRKLQFFSGRIPTAGGEEGFEG